MFITSPIAAQLSPFEGRRILKIQFSSQPTLDPTDLEKAQPLKTDAPLRAQDVASAIDGLFATGYFDDIVVEVEPSGESVIVRFVTKNRWFIGGLAVDGGISAPPNRGQLAGAGQLTLGGTFLEEDLTRALEGMKRLLEANGLYEAQVTPTIERAEDVQQVFITFDVKSGKRARYEMPAIQGDTQLPDSTVVRATGWRIPIVHWWRRVSDTRTRHGVQKLLGKYAKQDRLTARVDLQQLEYDAERRRVRPHLDIQAGPKVQVKTVEAKVSPRVLKRYVPIFAENTVDNDLLVEGKRNLRDYFQSKGYYDVDVDFRMQPLKEDVQTIEYVISRGQRQKLASISIVGNEYFDTPEIRERMFMQPASFNRRHGSYSEAFRRRDEESIANLYRSNGFRNVKVSSVVDRSYRGKEGEISVTLNISEGPQWIVENLTIEGMTRLNRDSIASNLASVEGQPFADASLSIDRNQVLTYYQTNGFPKADFKASWRQSDIPHHVSLVYTVTEGQQEYVRDVLTSGLKTTRQSLVDRKITLQPGDPLSLIEQVEIQKRFYDLGIFSRVDTAIQNPDGDTSHKYILYNFEEANRYTISGGIGAQVARFGMPSSTSLSAPAGSTGFSPSVSLDVSRINFRGIGHTVTFRGLYSSIAKRASLSYLAPRINDVESRDLTFTILHNDSLNVNTFASRQDEASIQLAERFSPSLTALFRFAYRRDSVSRLVIPALLVPQFLQPVRIGMLSANIAQDRRDNPADPHRGIYNTADVGLSAKFFGSQRSFGRILLRNATYHRLTRSLVLARQTQFAVIFPFAVPADLSEHQSVPLPERFFGGGADSLRAFPFNQAGPRDIGAPQTAGSTASQPTGFPLGGNALLFNNVELRFPLTGANIQGVLFHDMGNVYTALSNFSLRVRQRNLQDFDYAVHAVGFGIRYRTPIGPIRGDLAYSINPPAFLGFNGTPQELLQCNPNLPVLPSFCQGVRQRVSHFQFFFSIGQTF